MSFQQIQAAAEHSETLLNLAKAGQSCARTGVDSAEKEPKQKLFFQLHQVPGSGHHTVLQTQVTPSRPECETAFHSNTATKN